MVKDSVNIQQHYVGRAVVGKGGEIIKRLRTYFDCNIAPDQSNADNFRHQGLNPNVPGSGCEATVWVEGFSRRAVDAAMREIA